MNGMSFKPDIWIAKKKVLDQYGVAVTRRLDGLKEINQEPNKWEYKRTLNDGRSLFWSTDIMISDTVLVKPRYHTGETVYVKEAHYAYGRWDWARGEDSDDVCFIRDCDKPIYYADTNPQGLLLKKHHYFGDVGWYLRSPLFLKAIHARDFLRVSVRPERLQEITEEDAILEGMPEEVNPDDASPIMLYSDLWDEIYPDFPWASNPWCWRIEFKRVPRPEHL